MVERRTLIRRKAPVKRIFAADILDEPEASDCFVHIHDLSEGGMRIHTDFNLPLDRTVSLRLHLDEPIDLKVEKVWERPLVGGINVYGLKFQEPKQDAHKKLIAFLTNSLTENRRKAFRLERILVVEMLVNDKATRFGVFTLDLSTTGMRINHEDPLPENQTIDFRILLEPGTDPVAVRSKVSWQKENPFGHYLIGLQFTDLESEAQIRIEEYIEKAVQDQNLKDG